MDIDNMETVYGGEGAMSMGTQYFLFSLAVNMKLL
jgi:hypothetical protein